MRRVYLTLALVVALFALGTGAALAVSPHFVSATDSINSSGSIVVSWKEAGLGANELVSYTITADATAVWGAINGGGNHPKATNKETVSGPVTASGDFSSGKNGNITASLTAGPPDAVIDSKFSVPPGQTLGLISIEYTDVWLHDNTNGIDIQLPDIKKTLLNVK